MGMDWVAINGQVCRPRYGMKLDEAKKFYQKNGWMRPKQPLPQLTRIHVEHRDWKPCEEGELIINGRRYTNEDGDLEFDVVTGDEHLFPANVAKRINSSIQQSGMVVIRGAVDRSTIEKLRVGGTIERSHPDAAKIEETIVRSVLVFSIRKGMGGLAKKPSYTQEEKTQLVHTTVTLNTLKIHPESANYGSGSDDGDDEDTIRTAEVRKCILLKYSKGGENWAHRDANSDGFFKYQALLMLSNNDEYDGGEFYVARRSTVDCKIIRTCCPKLNAGDLVIFQADSTDSDEDYDHGMKMLTRGERVAVDRVVVCCWNFIEIQPLYLLRGAVLS
eukprot:scaffold25933_cov36-Attheya_sp.AAC.1